VGHPDYWGNKKCFVTGHDFSRAKCNQFETSALAAAMLEVANHLEQGLKPQSN
jgi:hypothetical protein